MHQAGLNKPVHCHNRDSNKSGTYLCQTDSTAPDKMGREYRTREEHEYRITLYCENKKEEIPDRPNGILADNSKCFFQNMRVRKYSGAKGSG